MSEFEITIELPGSQYGEVIIIEDYNGNYGLCLAKKGDKGGTLWKKWCYPQVKDKKPAEKAIPLKIPLGSRDDARQVSKQIAEAFGWIVTEPGKGTQKPVIIEDDSEIPF